MGCGTEVQQRARDPSESTHVVSSECLRWRWPLPPTQIRWRPKMPHTLSQVKEDAEPLPENLRYLIDNPEYQLTFTPLHTIK